MGLARRNANAVARVGDTLTGPLNLPRTTVASSASTSDIWSTGQSMDFTGTATVTAFPAAPAAGAVRCLRCTGACTFTNSANLVVQGAVSRTVAAGDIVRVEALTTTQFVLVFFNADGTPVKNTSGLPLTGGTLTGALNMSAAPINEAALSSISTGGGNAVQWSETFDNAYWIKARSSISANVTANPNGAPNADKLVEDTSTGSHYVGVNTLSMTSGQVYTFSVYLKAVERTNVALLFTGAGFTTDQEILVNLSAGTASVVSGSPTFTVTAAGSSWYRVSITATANATGTTSALIALYNGGISYTGDGASGAYVWGAQLAFLSNPGVYVPTLGGTTLDLDNVTSNYVSVGGANLSIALMKLANGSCRTLVFSSPCTLVYSSQMLLPTAANITVVVGDVVTFAGENANGVNTRVLSYQHADGTPINLSGTISGTLTGGDFPLSRVMMRDVGMVSLDMGNSGTTFQTLNYSIAQDIKLTVTGAFSLAMGQWPPTSNRGVLMLELVNGGAFTITWPTIQWQMPDGTHTTSISTYLAANLGRTSLQSSGTDFFMFWTRDSGTTVYGKLI